MEPRTTDTRLALIRAAETLFAERGFDAVSLREVSVAAGQANNSAVSYHFGNREGLIDAILERHSAPIQARYVAQIEALERFGSLSARALVEILALPIVAKLDDPDGGWAYLSLCAQLVVSPHLPLISRKVAQTPETLRLAQAMFSFATVPVEVCLFRIERMASMIYVATSQWHRLENDGMTHVPRAIFEHDLVDCLVDQLTQPSSTATRAALEAMHQAPPPPPATVPTQHVFLPPHVAKKVAPGKRKKTSRKR